jgi:hypothetical protein
VTMLDGVDRTAAIWFGGDVDGALGEPVANGAPFSKAIRGTVAVGGGILLKATIEYANIADARTSERVIDAAMHPNLDDEEDAPADSRDPTAEAAAGLVGGAMIGLLGDFSVGRRETLVDVVADLNRFGALAIGKMVEVGLSRAGADEATAPDGEIPKKSPPRPR